MTAHNSAVPETSFQSHILDICANMGRLAQGGTTVPSLLGIADNSFIVMKYNNFVECMGDSTKTDEMESRFRDMIIYINMHFVFEDNLMKMCHYSGYDSHHRQHVDFIEKLDSYLKSIINHTETLDQMILYIGHWLIGHILISDREFEDYQASLPDLGEGVKGTA